MERLLDVIEEGNRSSSLRWKQHLSDKIIVEYLKNDETLPFLQWKRVEDRSVEISMIAVNRVGGAMFFYEMISRWLVPLRQLHVSSYFAFEELIKEKPVIVASITVNAASESELQSIEMMLPMLIEELKLGLLSSYHAKRILEIKGLSISDKMGFVFDHLRKVITRFPSYYDYDLIPLMQRFFIHKTDEYRNSRSILVLEKTILSMYLVLKRIEKYHGGDRHVEVKVRKQTITHLFGERQVLCLTIGINFIKDSERFTRRHLEKAILEVCSDAHLVPESVYVEVNPEEKSRIYTVEVEFEKEPDEGNIDALYAHLPQAIATRIEQLTKPLVMPRNDEEVMKHMIMLSGQLSSPKDIPQMILSFSEQTEQSLVFRVILARILKDTSQRINTLIDEEKQIEIEKVRERGLVWKKYPKELAVLRMTIPLSSEERFGKRIQFMSARRRVQEKVERLLGPVRDYFGGMYEKELRHLDQLSLELNVDVAALELFYQGLFPTEYRTIFPAKLLAALYRLYRSVKQTGEASCVKAIATGNLFMRRFSEITHAQRILRGVQQEGSRPEEVLLFFREEYGQGFLGGIDISGSGMDSRILQKALEK